MPELDQLDQAPDSAPDLEAELSPPLSGAGVLVTRPLHQSEGLQRILERMGARAYAHPLLRIAAPLDPNTAQAALASIGASDMVVVVSANAVRAAVTILPDVASQLARPLIACLGIATAKALQGIGVSVDVMSETGSTSEALLAVDEISAAAVHGRHISIIKGEGGRSLVADTLGARGAHVQIVNVYRREPIGDGLAAVLDDNAGTIDMAIVTSGELLSRLHEVAGLARVQDLALVLPSDRVLGQAVALGLRGPFVVPRQVNDGELARAAARLLAGIHAANKAEHE